MMSEERDGPEELAGGAGRKSGKPAGAPKRFVAARTVDQARKPGRPTDREERITEEDVVPEVAPDSGLDDEAMDGEDQGTSGLRRKKLDLIEPGAIRRFFQQKLSLGLVLGVVFAVLLLSAIVAFRAGTDFGASVAREEATRKRPTLPPELLDQIDGALLQLRTGQGREALATLNAIDEEKEKYPSLSYLVALAAVHVGDVQLAEKKIAETLLRKERVSDALALQAVLETMKRDDPNRMVMGDPRVRSEEYLRQAISADPANPSPRFELATLLRYAGKRDESRKEIRAAQARVTPVDAHVVMEATVAIMDAEDLPRDQIPAPDIDPSQVPQAFSNAVLALRREDFPTAVRLLEQAQKMTSHDIFYYLINDPAFLRYKHRPEMAKFFQ